jgi:hypothetical protein
MKNSTSRKPKSTSSSAVNKLRVRIPLLLEVEGDGTIPVVCALVLCLILVGWIVLR